MTPVKMQSACLLEGASRLGGLCHCGASSFPLRPGALGGERVEGRLPQLAKLKGKKLAYRYLLVN